MPFVVTHSQSPALARRAASRPSPRPAVTLVELLLVLVLLVVIGSLAAPTLTGSFASTRLRRAGDEVVGAWSKARRFAIESGATYQFRFKPDDNVYRIEPFSTLDAIALTGDSYTPAAGQSASTSAAATSSASSSRYASSSTTSDVPNSSSTTRSRAQNDFDEEPEDKGLPDEVVFEGGQVAVDDPLLDETQVDQLDQRGDDWTRPILFFPNGAASDASIVLKNTRDQYIRVTLRGLTGVGRVTSILSKDEASKPESRRR